MNQGVADGVDSGKQKDVGIRSDGNVRELCVGCRGCWSGRYGPSGPQPMRGVQQYGNSPLRQPRSHDTGLQSRLQNLALGTFKCTLFCPD